MRDFTMDKFRALIENSPKEYIQIYQDMILESVNRRLYRPAEIEVEELLKIDKDNFIANRVKNMLKKEKF